MDGVRQRSDRGGLCASTRLWLCVLLCHSVQSENYAGAMTKETRQAAPLLRSYLDYFRSPCGTRKRERSQGRIDEILAKFNPGKAGFEMIVENPAHLRRLPKDAARHGQ